LLLLVDLFHQILRGSLSVRSTISKMLDDNKADETLLDKGGASGGDDEVITPQEKSPPPKKRKYAKCQTKLRLLVLTES
jgi:hypothetical protein